MLTCKSPRKVMRVAYRLACQCLPSYRCKFSRHDFTLAQLFACLVLKELLKLSYRAVEAVLADAESWRRDIGLKSTPDHTTLHQAARFLLARHRFNKLLDAVARWATLARLLNL